MNLMNDPGGDTLDAPHPDGIESASIDLLAANVSYPNQKQI
jgi:hypothetical protein